MNDEFARRLFVDPIYYEETPLVDRKREYEWHEAWAKTEFIRDVISLANTARLRCRPAYILLGLDDNGGRVGIEKTLQSMGINPLIENYKASELVKSEFGKLINNHIQPPLLRWDFRIITIEQQRLGYLIIEPDTPPQLFSVSRDKRAYKDEKDKSVYQGQSWIRAGESKESLGNIRISVNDPEYRYSCAEVPYVLPFIWQRYFEKVQRDMQKLTQDAPEESAYQELRDGKGIPIQKIVDDFLAQDDERLLILQGAAGCGKSLFLQRLVMTLAEQSEQEMKDAQRLEQFTPPNGLIPIFYCLKGLTPKARKESEYFTKTLCNLLAPLWESNANGQRPSHPERLFDNPRLQWLMVLDGLDEIGAYERRREFLNVLSEFIQTYPRLKVILTTRPSSGILLTGLATAKLIEIAPLDESQINGFFLAYRSDRNDEVIDAFLRQCKSWEDTWKLVRIPAYLNAAAQAIGVVRKITDVQEKPEGAPLVQPEKSGNEQKLDTPSVDVAFQPNPLEGSLETEDPVLPEPTKRLDDDRSDYFVQTLPQLLDRIYGAFWEREKKRQTIGDNLRCSTHKIAATLMTDCPAPVKRETARRLLKEKGVRWVLEMGIFYKNEHELLFFNTPSTQLYSAAKQLQGDVEGRFWDDARRYMHRWQDDYRDEVENFYNDLTGNSLPPILQPQGGSNG